MRTSLLLLTACGLLAAGCGRFPIDGLAYERAGTYDVTVMLAGYRAWTQTGVRVTRDEWPRADREAHSEAGGGVGPAGA